MPEMEMMWVDNHRKVTDQQDQKLNNLSYHLNLSYWDTSITGRFPDFTEKIPIYIYIHFFYFSPHTQIFNLLYHI